MIELEIIDDLREANHKLRNNILKLDFADVMAETAPSEQLDRAIDFLVSYLEPDDVFGETKLADWAFSKGYVQKD